MRSLRCLRFLTSTGAAAPGLRLPSSSPQALAVRSSVTRHSPSLQPPSAQSWWTGCRAFSSAPLASRSAASPLSSACHQTALSSHQRSSSPVRLSARRRFTSSRVCLGLEEFFMNQQPGRTGRPWRCSELRLKSFDDLQKLWFVLLKERNMLATYRHECHVSGLVMRNPERIRKVRRSMAHIKVVLGERYREMKDKTEPEDSPWRQRVAKVRELKARIRLSQRRQAALQKRVPRQQERHPMAKKIKFRKIHPTSPAEPAAEAGVTGASTGGAEKAQRA